MRGVGTGLVAVVVSAVISSALAPAQASQPEPGTSGNSDAALAQEVPVVWGTPDAIVPFATQPGCVYSSLVPGVSVEPGGQLLDSRYEARFASPDVTYELTASDCADPAANGVVTVPARVLGGASFEREIFTKSDVSRLFTVVLYPRAGVPLTGQLLRNGKVVKEATADGSDVVSFTANLYGKSLKGKWQVRLIADGVENVTDIRSRKKYGPGYQFMSGGSQGPWERCSTVTWGLSTKRMPGSVKGMGKDVRKAFAQMGKATGLKFRKVRFKDADIRVFFGKADGFAGLGGYEVVTRNGVRTVRGTVELSNRISWIKRPGFSDGPNRLPGRGALLLHEIGHVLGLDHSFDPGQVMHYGSSRGSPASLQSGDLAGLRKLYRPQDCK